MECGNIGHTLKDFAILVTDLQQCIKLYNQITYL